jgi:hypothetical protein
MSKNQNIFTELADFDIKYAKYIYCNDANKSDAQKASCTTIDKDPATLTAAYNTLVNGGANGANLRNLERVISGMQSDEKKTQADFEASYNATITQYNSMLELRRNLDEKMRLLYNIDNKVSTDKNLYSDSTVYSGIVWTVLASSIIYYMFSKL